MTIHENLRQLRLDCGMTQEEAARQIGVTRQTISSYESGRTRPDVELLIRFGELYGTDLDGILYGESRSLKAARRIRLAAAVWFILIGALLLVSAGFLWFANRFFPMPMGQLTEAGMAVFEVRRQLTGAWELTGGLAVAVSGWGSIVMLALLFTAKCKIALREKLLFAAALSAAALLPSALLGMTDSIYQVVDYVIVPIWVTARVILCLAVDVAGEWLLTSFKRKRCL